MEEKLREAARQIVAQYHATGLSGLSEGEVRVLLSEKRCHLAQVNERCSQGQDMHVNFALKRGLEAEIREIGNGLEGMTREGEREF